MMKIVKKTKIRTVFMALLATIAMFTALPPGISISQTSSPSVRSKPLHFYFHHIDASVSVAGMEAHYIMNTTRWFKFLTKAEAYAHSFHKPVGLPKIVVDFYLYPNLAGPVTFDGTWQVFVWVNGSAYKPCSFNVQFKEISVGGETLWSSGVLTPIVTSDIGAYIDVPIYNYNLSAPSLAHTFSPGTTLQVEVTINPGARAECRIWYDSPSYPSKVILPSQDHAQAISVKTYDVNNIETNIFSADWSKDQRRVIVRANVTDPFGGYDIYMVNVTIFDPANRTVLDNANMGRTSDGLWALHYLHTYEAKWSYSDKAMFGNYTAKVSVLDNNGHYHYLKSGSFEPYIEYGYHIFNIGIVVLYNPTFKVVDDADGPLPRAQVYVGFPNGTTSTPPLYTADNGSINLTQVPTGSYTFTILWKGVIVQQTTQYVDSDGPYTIKCRVYRLTVHVLGSNAAPISGAYVVIYTQAERVQDFRMTDASGQAIFQLPSSDILAVGAYKIDVYYSTGYWLTHVEVTATQPSISVTSSGPLTITLVDFPPPIWTTIGFWLVITASVMMAVMIIYLLRTRTRTIYLLKT